MSIVSLSSMLFMIPFENISVSSFSPDDRSGDRKDGGIWGGFIVEGDGSVGSIVRGVVVHISAFVV